MSYTMYCRCNWVRHDQTSRSLETVGTVHQGYRRQKLRQRRTRPYTRNELCSAAAAALSCKRCCDAVRVGRTRSWRGVPAPRGGKQGAQRRAQAPHLEAQGEKKPKSTTLLAIDSKCQAPTVLWRKVERNSDGGWGFATIVLMSREFTILLKTYEPTLTPAVCLP